MHPRRDPAGSVVAGGVAAEENAGDFWQVRLKARRSFEIYRSRSRRAHRSMLERPMSGVNTFLSFAL